MSGNTITNFIAYCLEEYKAAENLTGAETIALFAEHGIIPYLESCYEALHVLGPVALVDDIRGIIRKQTIKTCKTCKF